MTHYIDPLLKCGCGAVELQIIGSPAACAYCHCDSCRDFYGLPMLSATAWKRESVQLVNGAELVGEFAHPAKQMRRYFCTTCGETLFGTNRLGMAVVGTSLIARSFNGSLPAHYRPTSHLFYAYREIDIEDSLPKYLEGRTGLLFQKLASSPDV